MKIAVINTYSNGSTGTIASLIGKYSETHGCTVRYFYGREKNSNQNWEFFGESKITQFISNLFTYLTGKVGSFHYFSTKHLLRELKSFQPDVIHLHNIHGNYLNFKLLFNFLKNYKGKVIITAHDEFLLTGRCALCCCDKWKCGCSNCKHLSAYPRALFDRSKKLQQEKIKMLREIPNLEIVTPSLWLDKFFKESTINFIKHTCIHNGISFVSPEMFDVENIVSKQKTNLLFAAYTWSKDKGAEIIQELSQKIDINRFNIIVAGYDDYCQKWFSSNCIKLPLLSRQKLLYLMSKVDLFINPTFKDNLPTILIEALQVGTPCITFDTGGCSEIIDKSCGFVLKEKNTDCLLYTINNFKITNELKIQAKEKAKLFSLEEMGNKYLSLYKELKK